MASSVHVLYGILLGSLLYIALNRCSDLQISQMSHIAPMVMRAYIIVFWGDKIIK